MERFWTEVRSENLPRSGTVRARARWPRPQRRRRTPGGRAPAPRKGGLLGFWCFIGSWCPPPLATPHEGGKRLQTSRMTSNAPAVRSQGG